MAKVALHFNCLPTEPDPVQITGYLYLVKQEHFKTWLQLDPQGSHKVKQFQEASIQYLRVL